MVAHMIAALACLAGTVLTLNCTDWQGKPVSHGEEFYPKKEDLCYLCRCDRGYQTMCMTVSCSPPNCQKWVSVEGQCCKFKCLDGTAGSIDPEVHRPNYTGDTSGENSGGKTVLTNDNLTDLGLRLVASTVTTFLILALLLFLIHRLRQRRLLMALRRYSRRQGRFDDSDSVSCTPDLYGLEYSSYMDPPPPYSPPKPSSIAPGEQPPPYEMVISSSSQNNGDTLLPNSESQNQHLGYCNDLTNTNASSAQEVNVSNNNPGNGEIMLRSQNEQNQNSLEPRQLGSNVNANSDQNRFDTPSQTPIILSGVKNRAIRNGSDISINMVSVQGGNMKYMPRMSQSFSHCDISQETSLSCSTFSSGYNRRGPVNGHMPQTLHTDCTEYIPSHDLPIEMHVNSRQSATTNIFSIDRNNNLDARSRIMYAELLTSGQHTCDDVGEIRPEIKAGMTLLAKIDPNCPLALSETGQPGIVSMDFDDCCDFTVITAGENSNQNDVESVGAVRSQETRHQHRLLHSLNTPVPPLSLSPNDYPVQGSVSITSDMSMYPVCSEMGERREASHYGNVISNDVPYPINSYKSFLKSEFNAHESNTEDKSINHNPSVMSKGGDTSQSHQRPGSQPSEVSVHAQTTGHQFINKNIKPESEDNVPSHCTSDMPYSSLGEAFTSFMPPDVSHRALSKPGDHNSKDIPYSKSNKMKSNRLSTGSPALPKGPKLSILTQMSSHSGGKQSPKVKRSSFKSKDKVAMSDKKVAMSNKKRTKQTDLIPIKLTCPCEYLDSYKEYGLFNNPRSELVKGMEEFRTNKKCEDLMRPLTTFAPVSALNYAPIAEAHHTYSPSVENEQEYLGLFDQSHGNHHHSNSYKRNKSFGKGDISMKTVPDNYGNQLASGKPWGKSSHCSRKSKPSHSLTGARMFHEELETALGKRQNAASLNKSKNKKRNAKNGTNFLGISSSECSLKESVIENTCSYV